MSSSNKSFSSYNKKLHISLNKKSLDLINKVTDKNAFNNNKYNNNIVHNLSKINNKKNSNLLEKITKKVTAENIFQKSFKFNNKENESSSKSQSVPSAKSSNNSNDEKVEDNSDKKESNEEDDDFLLEQKDLMDVDDTELININKIETIQVHPNFIQGHNFTASGFNYNTNTNKSNKSSINARSNTEPNNQNLYMNDLPSGRSNNSGNGLFFIPDEKKNKNINTNKNYSDSRFYPNNRFIPKFKSSFLSTNTNSHNQSGLKIDSSQSSESGISNYQSNIYNHTMNNFRTNNFCFPLVTNVTPIGNRHFYNNSFISNENLYNQKQLFSPNVGPYKKREYNKFSRNNFGFKVEKQVINLDNVALGKETRTTVMIRNIPIKYDTIVLEKELKPFEGKYDCIYMPYDYGNEGNKGYAFLNLTNPYHILLFYDYFYNKSWLYFESKKICELNYANFQGIEEISKHARNYKGSKKPVFFICTKDDNLNNKIEVPMKYLPLMKKANPNMKYHELEYTFIVDSLE
jgi:hypothetical protein